MEENDFLDRYVFQGLENINDGFDSDSIKYFTESDFRTVLERVEKLDIEVLGIEPWKDGSFYNVLVAEQFESYTGDSKWYWEAFKKFSDSGEILQYAATFSISDQLLNEHED